MSSDSSRLRRTTSDAELRSQILSQIKALTASKGAEVTIKDQSGGKEGSTSYPLSAALQLVDTKDPLIVQVGNPRILPKKVGAVLPGDSADRLEALSLALYAAEAAQLQTFSMQVRLAWRGFKQEVDSFLYTLSS